jgi:hypothetical protein
MLFFPRTTFAPPCTYVLLFSPVLHTVRYTISSLTAVRSFVFSRTLHKVRYAIYTLTALRSFDFSRTLHTWPSYHRTFFCFLPYVLFFPHLYSFRTNTPHSVRDSLLSCLPYVESKVICQRSVYLQMSLIKLRLTRWRFYVDENSSL